MGSSNSKRAKVMAWTMSPLLVGFWMLTLYSLNKLALPKIVEMQSHPAALIFGTLCVLGSILVWIIFMAWLSASTNVQRTDTIPIRLMAGFNTTAAALNSIWWFKNTVLKEDALRQWLGGAIIVVFTGMVVLIGTCLAIQFATGNSIRSQIFTRPSS
jgi:hypothetical protein